MTDYMAHIQHTLRSLLPAHLELADAYYDTEMMVYVHLIKNHELNIMITIETNVANFYVTGRDAIEKKKYCMSIINDARKVSNNYKYNNIKG